MTEQRDGAGHVISYIYDSMRNMASMTDPYNAVTTFERDDRGQVTCEINSDGGMTKYEYDLLGNITKKVYPNGITQRSEYDLMSREVKSVNVYGLTTDYKYNARGDVTKTVDSHGNQVDYTYDKWGRMISSKDSTGKSQMYTYDEHDRIASEANEAGFSIEYKYDMISTTNKATGTASYIEGDRKSEYSYTKTGEIIGVNGGKTSETSEYNQGRLKSIAYPSGNCRAVAMVTCKASRCSRS